MKLVQAGADPLVIHPFTLTIVFARCGNVPLLSHRLAVLSKKPGSIWELENFQDPPLTSLTGGVAINGMCEQLNGFYVGSLCSLVHSLCIQLALKWMCSVRKGLLALALGLQWVSGMKVSAAGAGGAVGLSV